MLSLPIDFVMMILITVSMIGGTISINNSFAKKLKFSDCVGGVDGSKKFPDLSSASFSGI